jgi:hypothetical protein
MSTMVAAFASTVFQVLSAIFPSKKGGFCLPGRCGRAVGCCELPPNVPNLLVSFLLSARKKSLPSLVFEQGRFPKRLKKNLAVSNLLREIKKLNLPCTRRGAKAAHRATSASTRGTNPAHRRETKEIRDFRPLELVPWLVARPPQKLSFSFFARGAVQQRHFFEEEVERAASGARRKLREAGRKEKKAERKIAGCREQQMEGMLEIDGCLLNIVNSVDAKDLPEVKSLSLRAFSLKMHIPTPRQAGTHREQQRAGERDRVGYRSMVSISAHSPQTTYPKCSLSLHFFPAKQAPHLAAASLEKRLRRAADVESVPCKSTHSHTHMHTPIHFSSQSTTLLLLAV